jgi:putative endonuclease
MAYFVYIIFSKALDKYYIGYTEDLELRLKQHNNGFYKDSYTKLTNDWSMFHCIECSSKTQAIRVEAHIKKMKSRVYIENLKNHPEISLALMTKY